MGSRGLITTPERSRLMSSVKHEDTSAELRARRVVHACGLRFRVGAKDLPGTPDIVNRRAKWAIFVHGCFWRLCTKRRSCTINRGTAQKVGQFSPSFVLVHLGSGSLTH
ncbi:MAG: hypothetical protein ACHQ9S_11850 [Candidatus Binatia bacterium]